jgi:hypothetical protein
MIRLGKDKHSSLLQTLVNYGQREFYNIGPWAHFNLISLKEFNVCSFAFLLPHGISRGLYYKTYYGRHLRIFVINQSVCPWQAFPAKSNVYG